MPWTLVLEKTRQSPLNSKEIKPVSLNGHESWILTGKTNSKAEAPVLWSFYWNCWLIGKVPDAKNHWVQKERRASEDEMAGWHYWFNGHELGQTPGDGEGQERLASYSPWGLKESEMTGWNKSSNSEIKKLLLYSSISSAFLCYLCCPAKPVLLQHS